MWADEIYTPSEVLLKRNKQEGLFFDRMTSSRTDIEHIFGLVWNLWKRIERKHTWHLIQMKDRVFTHMFAIFFMTNVYTCMNGNKTATSTKYNFKNMDINEYYLNVTPEEYFLDDDEYMQEHLH